MPSEYTPTLDTAATLPNSMEAEQAVLGSLLVDPDCLTLIQSEGFKSEYFYYPQHRRIYNSIVKLVEIGGKFDQLLVLEDLKVSGTFDDAAGKQYLIQLAESVPSTAHIEEYAKIIRDKYYKRSLIEASSEILEQTSNEEADSDTLLDSAEQKIFDIRQGQGNAEAKPFGEIMMNEVYPTLYKLNSEDKADYLGISTGYSELDNTIAGLNKSDLIIVGARPAMGKTSLALNLATNVAKKYHKVMFFSLEMTKEQLASRVISMEARIQGQKMRTGELTDDDWERLSTVAGSMDKVPLFFDDTSNISVNEMKAKILRARDVECVIIDYLQLMKSPNRTESRVQEVSEITRNLKLMAKDLKIPVIVLAQLARGTEARGKSHRPQLADLRESGSIEQDADIVLMLYREDYYSDTGGETEDDDEKKAVDTCEIIVAKNRHGPVRTVELGWNGEFTLFLPLERNRESEF